MVRQFSGLLAPGRACLALAALVFLSGGLAQAAPIVGYQFDVTTSYATSFPPATNQVGPSPGPDTGFATIVNSGTTTFTGTVSLVGTAVAGASVAESFTGTLAPGQSVVFSAGPEGSNQGGFNSIGSAFPQNGLKISLAGTVALGTMIEPISTSVFDKDIHSLVFRNVHAPPSSEGGAPLFSDAYVLQGGDPFGGDTGDAFEESQSAGHFRLFEGVPAAAVPEPATLLLFGAGLTGLAALARRRRR